MRFVAVVLMLIGSGAGFGAAGAPTYDVTRSVGDHPFLFAFRQSAEPALTAPQDNTLSAWRALPFSWKFFGRDVNGYFISDNGYITFDREAKTSAARPGPLAADATPKNSILAYWTDLRLDAGQNQWTNSVWTATLGTAPARVHLIYWMSVAPASAQPAASALSFLIALHENGEFEVIYTAARKSAALAATVGAVSPDGSVRVTAAGPGFDFPGVGFGGEDDVAFRFKPVDKQS